MRGFVDGIVGFGLFGLAQIVAEAGALDAYDNPAKLWRRMGLAVASGVAERRLAGVNSGYSPRRRTIMFVIGEALIKKQNRYRALYLERKVIEEQKAPSGSKLLWHRRAHRYMEKRLLRDLWSAWRCQEATAP